MPSPSGRGGHEAAGEGRRAPIFRCGFPSSGASRHLLPEGEGLGPYSSARYSKNRQRVQRGSCAAFDWQRRERDEKFIALQTARRFDHLLKVQILDDVDAHPVEYSLMDRIAWNVLFGAP